MTADHATERPTARPASEVARATLRVVLYNLALFVASPVLFIVFVSHAMLDRRVREGHAYRCGFKLPPKPRKTTVWLHAVSVGEVNSVKRLIELILATGRYEVYLSTTTATGFASTRKGTEQTCLLPCASAYLPWSRVTRVSPSSGGQ